MKAAALILPNNRQFPPGIVLPVLLLVLQPAMLVADDLDPPPWRGSAGSSYQLWEFNSFPTARMDHDSVNCSSVDEQGTRWGHRGAPDEVNNPFQKLNRICAEFKTMWSFTDRISWLKTRSGRKGVWRLAASADTFNSLDFVIPNKLSTGMSSKRIQVQVIYETASAEPVVIVQVLDTGIDSGHARLQPVNASEASPLPLGWLQRTYHFELSHCPSFENIRIFSEERDDLYIDSVVVDSICQSPS